MKKYKITRPFQESLSSSQLFYKRKVYLQVPYESEIAKITKELHVLNGRHLPRNEHIARVSQFYYWDSVKISITRFAEKCLRCKLNKIPTQTKPLKVCVNTILSTRPLERVQFDLIKIPTLYSSKLKYIMTVKDHFSRMARAYLLTDKSAITTSKNLSLFLNQYTPEMVQTDNGTEFKGAFSKLLDDKKIKHIRGRPYHPESQGSIESFNKYLKQEIPKYLSKFDKNQLDSATALTNFLDNYNNHKKHSATKKTPHSLFNEKSLTKIEEVIDLLKRKEKYQKQYYSAKKGSRIFILSCFRENKERLMYAKTSKNEKEVIGIGTLLEDFNQGYVQVQIEKWLNEDKIYTGKVELDAKICVPISEAHFIEFMECS